MHTLTRHKIQVVQNTLPAVALEQDGREALHAMMHPKLLVESEGVAMDMIAVVIHMLEMVYLTLGVAVAVQWDFQAQVALA
jgi:hypothetical protein